MWSGFPLQVLTRASLRAFHCGPFHHSAAVMTLNNLSGTYLISTLFNAIFLLLTDELFLGFTTRLTLR
jgi:hypothetical protein